MTETKTKAEGKGIEVDAAGRAELSSLLRAPAETKTLERVVQLPDNEEHNFGCGAGCS